MVHPDQQVNPPEKAWPFSGGTLAAKTVARSGWIEVDPYESVRVGGGFAGPCRPYESVWSVRIAYESAGSVRVRSAARRWSRVRVGRSSLSLFPYDRRYERPPRPSVVSPRLCGSAVRDWATILVGVVRGTLGVERRGSSGRTPVRRRGSSGRTPVDEDHRLTAIRPNDEDHRQRLRRRTTRIVAGRGSPPNDEDRRDEDRRRRGSAPTRIAAGPTRIVAPGARKAPARRSGPGLAGVG